MSSWRCPHCGSAQAEAALCWVCQRSTTSCASCHHFRKAIVAGMGYCALDRRHSPLTGFEERGCWEPSAAEEVQPQPAATAPTAGPVRAGLPHGSLWGTAKVVSGPADSTVRVTGMWPDRESINRSGVDLDSHRSSIPRPWGRVPGWSYDRRGARDRGRGAGGSNPG